MEFASCVKHRILTADPNNIERILYTYFSLNCERACSMETLLTEIPKLSKETLKNIQLEDLIHYNRSMDGNSMINLEGKKNVMEILHQIG